MNRIDLLGELMTQMAELGYPFLHEISRATAMGAPNAMVQDAKLLLSQLSGSSGEDAKECMRYAARDLLKIEELVEKWKPVENDVRSVDLLRTARQMLGLLRKFNETLEEMSLPERLDAEQREQPGNLGTHLD